MPKELKVVNTIISPDKTQIQTNYEDDSFETRPLTSKEISDLVKKEKRDEILSEGKVIGGFWFNEDYAHKFIGVMSSSIHLGLTDFRWKKADGEVVSIGIEQAKKMAKMILEELAKLYLE